MALRLHMYSGRLYEKMVKGKGVYLNKKLIVPRPEFYVLYNGKEPYPDKTILHLSDSFEKIDIPGIEEETLLELKVKVININDGRNKEMVRKSKELYGYSVFIAKIQEYKRELGNLETAVKKAIEYCCKHDIIKEFLEKHAQEVMSMLMTEFNLEDAKKVWFEEGQEDGMEKGRNKASFEIARKLLAENSTYEFVQKITGLDINTIKTLGATEHR